MYLLKADRDGSLAGRGYLMKDKLGMIRTGIDKE
jgi:hypothetical protein